MSRSPTSVIGPDLNNIRAWYDIWEPESYQDTLADRYQMNGRHKFEHLWMGNFPTQPLKQYTYVTYATMPRAKFKPIFRTDMP